MKGVLWFALLAGCGRIGFDARDDARGGDSAVADARKFFIDGGECPPGYTFDTLGCYQPYLLPNMLGWIDAEARCEQDAYGAHLVVIDSAAEAAIVDRQVPGTILEHWIGVTDIVTEGTFLGVDGQAPGYQSWAAGEPAGGTARNCLVFFDDTTEATQDCATVDDFVCEYDGVAPDPAAWGQ